jgi:rhamnose utilization protein RhaD (predicted bifunctional aldolase and dehydrogenase)
MKDKALADLIRISKNTGADPAITQAGGGNTSVKTDDGKYMFIKASGTALKNITANAGWRRLRLDKILETIKKKRRAGEPEIARRLLLACDDGLVCGAKPSIETHLHATLDKYVIHVHPLAVCAYVSARNGRSEIEKLFKKESRLPLWIPYAHPGYTLAKKASRLVAAYYNRYGAKPSVIFLAKHGLFVTAKTASDVIGLLHKVINRCKSNLRKKWGHSAFSFLLPRPAEKNVLSAKAAIRKAIKNITGRRQNVSFFFNKDVASFLGRKNAASLLAKGALSAAELVYSSGPPAWIDEPCEKQITARLKVILKKGRNMPSALVVKGLGLFIAADGKNASVIADVAVGSLIVRQWASHLGGVLPLTSNEQDFIKRWYCLKPCGLRG